MKRHTQDASHGSYYQGIARSDISPLAHKRSMKLTKICRSISNLDMWPRVSIQDFDILT